MSKQDARPHLRDLRGDWPVSVCVCVCGERGGAELPTLVLCYEAKPSNCLGWSRFTAVMAQRRYYPKADDAAENTKKARKVIASVLTNRPIAT